MEIEKDNFLPIEYMFINEDLYKKVGKELLPAKMATYKALFGSSDLKKIPVFNKFELMPSHINWKQTTKTPYGYNYNQYKQLSYDIKKGNWSNINKILKHIGGDRYPMLLEWLWVLYNHPDRQLVSLAFTGPRKSGKTSFLKLLGLMLEGNYLDADTKLVTADYNDLIAGKLIMSVDEKIEGRDSNKELQTIKKNMSAAELYINPKNKTPYTIKNIIKYVFCSNDMDRPFKLESENERILVFDVPRIKDSDERVLTEMKKEIAAFAFYLQNEFESEYSDQLLGDGKNRFWFGPDLLVNDASKRIQSNSKPADVFTIEELIEDVFENTEMEGIDEFFVKQKDLVSILNDKRITTKWLGIMLANNIECEYKGCARPSGGKRQIVPEGYSTYRVVALKKPIGAWCFTRKPLK